MRRSSKNAKVPQASVRKHQVGLHSFRGRKRIEWFSWILWDGMRRPSFRSAGARFMALAAQEC
jgi:hypothetical protein